MHTYKTNPSAEAIGCYLFIFYTKYAINCSVILNLFWTSSAFTCGRNSNQSLGSCVICDDDVLFTYGAYLSEVFRSAYSSVGKDQLEAAYIVGMTDTQALIRIIIPQAFLIALPNLGNYTIDLVKDTAIAFTIGLIDIMGQVKIILGNNYGIGMFEVYVIIAIVYWLICMSIELVTMLLERNL